MRDDVFIATHTCHFDVACCGGIEAIDSTEILGVFTSEKAAKKYAKEVKKEHGHRGKEAKLHRYDVTAWVVHDGGAHGRS